MISFSAKFDNDPNNLNFSINEKFFTVDDILGDLTNKMQKFQPLKKDYSYTYVRPFLTLIMVICVCIMLFVLLKSWRNKSSMENKSFVKSTHPEYSYRISHLPYLKEDLKKFFDSNEKVDLRRLYAMLSSVYSFQSYEHFLYVIDSVHALMKNKMVIAIGATGAGKTFLIQTICEIIGRKNELIRSQFYTTAPFVGEHLQIPDLLKFQKATAIFDEADKNQLAVVEQAVGFDDLSLYFTGAMDSTESLSIVTNFIDLCILYSQSLNELVDCFKMSKPILESIKKEIEKKIGRINTISSSLCKEQCKISALSYCKYLELTQGEYFNLKLDNLNEEKIFYNLFFEQIKKQDTSNGQFLVWPNSQLVAWQQVVFFEDMKEKFDLEVQNQMEKAITMQGDSIASPVVPLFFNDSWQEQIEKMTPQGIEQLRPNFYLEIPIQNIRSFVANSIAIKIQNSKNGSHLKVKEKSNENSAIQISQQMIRRFQVLVVGTMGSIKGIYKRVMGTFNPLTCEWIKTLEKGNITFIRNLDFEQFYISIVKQHVTSTSDSLISNLKILNNSKQKKSNNFKIGILNSRLEKTNLLEIENIEIFFDPMYLLNNKEKNDEENYENKEGKIEDNFSSLIDNDFLDPKTKVEKSLKEVHLPIFYQCIALNILNYVAIDLGYVTNGKALKLKHEVTKNICFEILKANKKGKRINIIQLMKNKITKYARLQKVYFTRWNWKFSSLWNNDWLNFCHQLCTISEKDFNKIFDTVDPIDMSTIKI